jgi:hypothetical protein
VWIFPYLIGMGIISYFGGFGQGGAVGGLINNGNFIVGGSGRLGFGWDLLVVAVFALVIYYTAIYFRLPASKVDEYASHLYAQEDKDLESIA